MKSQELWGRLDALKDSLKIDAVDAIWDDSFALGNLGKRIRDAIYTDGESYDYGFETAKSYIAAQIDIAYGQGAD